MLSWLLGRKSVEQLIAGGEYQWAIDKIHAELGSDPSSPKSRPLRQALADALALAGRKAEAVAVLRDLGREYVKAGQSDKAIAIQKKLEQLVPGGDAARDLAAAVLDEAPSEAQSAMAKTPLFSDFSKDELRAVILGLRFHALSPGEVVMVEGEPGDSLYVLTDGVVRVYVKNASGRSVQIREMEAGTFFGEISVVYGRPRTATLTCMTYCELLELDRAAVDRIVKDHPRVETVLKQFCDRRAGSSEERSARQGS